MEEIDIEREWEMIQVEEIFKTIFKDSLPLPDDFWRDLALHIDAVYHKDEKKHGDR